LSCYRFMEKYYRVTRTADKSLKSVLEIIFSV
jgi:hypothetical protein